MKIITESFEEFEKFENFEDFEEFVKSHKLKIFNLNNFKVWWWRDLPYKNDDFRHRVQLS